MSIICREISPQDLGPALRLWEKSGGIGLSYADSVESLESFLQRNPGLSYVAMEDSTIVGAVLGHDGRRGYLHHLAVIKSHRRAGIGRQKVENCLSALRAIGIMKRQLLIFTEYIEGTEFWWGIGWTLRQELAMMSAWASIEGHTHGGPEHFSGT